MQKRQIEQLIRIDKTNPTITVEMDFKDGVKRSYEDLKELLKGSQSESLINRLSGYQCITNALKQVREAIKSYLDIPDIDKAQIVGRSLWTHAVIEYCKCYQSNEGWTVTLEPSATIKSETPVMKEGHKWFMDQRHTFLAHGGKSSAQQSLVYVGRQLVFPFQVDGILCNTVTAAAPTNEAMSNLDHLAEVSLKYVAENVWNIERKIFIKLLEAKYVLHPEIFENYKLVKLD